MGQGRVEQFPKRIGILGDVHTESRLLEVAIERLRGLGADKLICVGDIVDGPEEAWGADRCCTMLQSHGIATVCGNHDRWLLEGTMRDLSDALEPFELEAESLDFLGSLVATACIRTAGGDLLLCHGLGRDDMASLSAATLSPPDPNSRVALQQVVAGGYRFVASGHTHHRGVHTVEQTVFINAGTLHRDFKPVFALLDIEAGEVHFHSLTEPATSDPLERVPF